jgi:hypothetical protein
MASDERTCTSYHRASARKTTKPVATARIPKPR